jgi:hypothetical protein
MRDTPSTFDQFREYVVCDAAAMERLTRCGSEAALFAEVLAMGREHGFGLEETDFAEIVRANRRLWLERWTRQ